MILGNRATLVVSFFLASLTVVLLYPPSAMSTEKDEKNSAASTSEKTSIEARIEQELQVESPAFSLGTLLGDPQKESIRTIMLF